MTVVAPVKTVAPAFGNVIVEVGLGSRTVKKAGRQGDGGMKGWRNGEMEKAKDFLVSLSPCLPVSLSLRRS
jgi:hypothetical protein